MKNKIIEVENKEYELITNYRNGFDKEEFEKRYTDYFDDYDYIVGDWAQGKLRLKGFYDTKNKKCKKINDIAGLESYIENNCAYGCRWFEIKKIND